MGVLPHRQVLRPTPTRSQVHHLCLDGDMVFVFLFRQYFVFTTLLTLCCLVDWQCLVCSCCHTNNFLSSQYFVCITLLTWCCLVDWQCSVCSCYHTDKFLSSQYFICITLLTWCRLVNWLCLVCSCCLTDNFLSSQYFVFITLLTWCIINWQCFVHVASQTSFSLASTSSSSHY